MNNIFGIVALLSLAVPGFFINSLILGKKRPVESLSISWLTGSVVFTAILFALNNYLGIKLDLLISCLTYLGLTIVSFFLAFKNISLPKLGFNKYRVLKICVIAFFVLVFATSIFYPVADWDAITLYDFRAKILTSTGFIEGTTIQMLYGGYPMYTSLLHFWTYVTGLWTPMPIYPLFTISLFAAIYFILKNICSRKIAFIISIASIFTPRLFANSFIAYTNLPYAVFLIIGAIFIYLWTENRDWRNLIIGIILSAATFWVRSFPFALVNFALIFLAIPLVKKYSKYLSIIAAILLIGAYFLPPTHEVANYLKWAVFGHYFPYWIIFAGLFIYKLIRGSKDFFWELAYLGFGLMLLVGTYIFENRFPGYSLSYNDAVRRMTIFLNPIVVLGITTIFKSIKQNEKNI